MIICRNVLIYLDPRKIPLLLEQIHDCLAEGGWLLVAAAETPVVNPDRFERVRLGETMFFRKLKSSETRPGSETTVTENECSTHAQGNPAEQPADDSIPVSRRRLAGGQDGSLKVKKKVAGREGPAAESLDAERQQTLAALYLEQRNFAAARDALRKALYLDRNNIMAHLLQGHLCRAEGEKAKACRSYQIAMRLLERLAPGLEVDKIQHQTAGELAAVLRETLNGLQ